MLFNFSKYRINSLGQIGLCKLCRPRSEATFLHLIGVYTVCHMYSNILDTSRGSRMDYFKF